MRTTLTELLLILCVLHAPIALAEVTAPPSVGYLDTVIGDVRIVVGEESRSALVGEFLYSTSQIRVGEESMARLILRADGYRMIDVAAEQEWSWGNYERNVKAKIGVALGKVGRAGAVMRSDDEGLSWSLPSETALAILPLNLDWRTDARLVAQADVVLRDCNGRVVDQFAANGVASFTAAKGIEAARTYTWTVTLKEGLEYQGKFVLLPKEQLEAIKATFYDFPASIAGDPTRELHHKAMVLMENRLYLDAALTLRDHIVVRPDDKVARLWLVMLSNFLRQ